jgi:hypothetical protein
MKLGAAAGAKSTAGSKKRGLDYHRRCYRILRTHHQRHLYAEGWTLLIEPWYWDRLSRRYRQPDAVLIHKPTRTGVVIEVKLNWKFGRDIKLVDEYLPIVRQAEGLEVVWPLLITQCLRGYQGPVVRWPAFEDCQSWQVGEETPLMLML